MVSFLIRSFITNDVSCELNIEHCQANKNWPLQILFGNFWWALSYLWFDLFGCFMLNTRYNRIQSKTIEHVYHQHANWLANSINTHITQCPTYRLKPTANQVYWINSHSNWFIFDKSIILKYNQSAVTNELHSKANKNWVS